MKDQKSIDIAILNEEGVVQKSVDLAPVYLLGSSITRYAQSNLPDESKYIEDAFKEAGCNVKRISVSWPRNSYVRLGKVYYTPGFFYERDTGFAFLGNGGGVIPGEGFALVSSIRVPPRQANVIDAIYKIMPVDIYLIPPFCDISMRPHSDIDTTVGCIPKACLVTVDKRHYDRDTEYFREVEKGTGYEVVPIDCGDELLGNNYRIIHELERTVINNKAATRVNAELRNLKINVIETSESLQLMPFLGGVRCATHWIHNESLLEYITLLQSEGVDDFQL